MKISKFRRNMIIIIGTIIFLILIFSSISLSYTKINYKEIAISSGDTLWSIAKYEKNNNDYFDNRDIRDIIDEIKYLNNLTNSNLNIGDKLSIPTI